CRAGAMPAATRGPAMPPLRGELAAPTVKSVLRAHPVGGPPSARSLHSAKNLPFCHRKTHGSEIGLLAATRKWERSLLLPMCSHIGISFLTHVPLHLK